MKFEDWLEKQKSRSDNVGEMARDFAPFYNRNVTFNNSGGIKMEASVNQVCDAARRADTCLEVGLEGIASAQRTGFAAESTAQRGFNHVDGTAQRMAIAELDAIGKVESEVCDSSRDVIAATERLGLENLRASERAGDRAVNSSERMGLFNNSSIERTADKTQDTVERSSYKTQDEVEKFGFRELDAINCVEKSVHGAERYLYAGMSQNAKDMLLEFERTKLHMKDDHREILLNIKDGNKDLLLQNCSNAKDAALTARDLMHQADKNTSAIQIEALKNKEELARQIAECCCEQKELTREKANETQQLIRELDKERIRDELAKTREELIALRVRATLTPPLVGSVPL